MKGELDGLVAIGGFLAQWLWWLQSDTPRLSPAVASFYFSSLFSPNFHIIYNILKRQPIIINMYVVDKVKKGSATHIKLFFGAYITIQECRIPSLPF